MAAEHDGEPEWFARPPTAHDERMNRESERAWNAKLGRGRVTAEEAQVVATLPAVRSESRGLVNPMDAAPQEFVRQLSVRSENRGILIQWVKDKLVRGTDFDKLHTVGRKTCDKGPQCTNPYHFSKDTLFKPGAEKICGMLGVTPAYPDVERYQQAAMDGRPIEHIILRCQILSVDGRVLSEGVGARSLVQDQGVLNKALKMAKKSAHIDAVLNLGGLSEVFTHPDKPELRPQDRRVIPAGRYAGKAWAEASEAYLQGVETSPKSPENMKSGAKAELARRADQAGFDDDIPF